MKHRDIQAPDIHQFAYTDATDPALDVDNGVTAKKMWFRPSDQRMLVRNDANDDWILIGGE